MHHMAMPSPTGAFLGAGIPGWRISQPSGAFSGAGTCRAGEPEAEENSRRQQVRYSLT